MYNVGQADNLLSGGKVAYPSYKNESLTSDDYPCAFTKPDETKRPVSIPLGLYDGSPYAYPENEYVENENDYVEHYVDNTQQKMAGEMSDKNLLVMMIFLLLILAICTMLAFQK